MQGTVSYPDVMLSLTMSPDGNSVVAVLTTPLRLTGAVRSARAWRIRGNRIACGN